VPRRTFLIGVYGIFGSYFLYFLSFKFAPPIQVNLVYYVWPAVMVVLSPAFIPAFRLHPVHLVAAVTGFAGTALIITGGRMVVALDHALGYLCAMGAALVWATYSLMIRKTAPFPGAATSAFCLCSGVLSLGVHVCLEPPFALGFRDLSYLLFTGLGPIGGAVMLWNIALRRGDPRIMGAFVYLTPLLSTLILVFVDQDRFGWVTAAAMGLIISGAVIASTGNDGSRRARVGRQSTGPVPGSGRKPD
jgi:drug/metabolite transporter (DMT)-like permease